MGETEAILLGLLLYILIQQIMGGDDGRRSVRALDNKTVDKCTYWQIRPAYKFTSNFEVFLLVSVGTRALGIY